MYSRLFRRETGRRLRAVADQVVEDYVARRFTWLNAYSRPSPDGLREYVLVLAEAIARDDLSLYFDYTVSQIGELLEAGTAPVALLAAGDLLQETILQLLTRDQRDYVSDVFSTERQNRQSVLYDQILPADERGA
jgi:hypothetical protein